MSRNIEISADDYDIRDRYITFNKKYFSDKLPYDIPLSFANLSAYKALGVFWTHNAKTPNENHAIQLDNRYAYTKEGYDGILLHEMVHAYCRIVLKNYDSTNGGHHKIFWDLFNHVDSLARADGYDMPSTEAESMRDFATGKVTRTNFCLATFKLKTDPESVMRYTIMQPSVFNELVKDFKFKNFGDATLFYTKALQIPFYGNIDLERGIRLVLTNSPELSMFMDSNRISASNKFFGGSYYALSTEDVILNVRKKRARIVKSEDRLIKANPTAYNIVDKASRHPTAVAMLTDKGLLINGEIVHRAPTVFSEDVARNATNVAPASEANKEYTIFNFYDLSPMQIGQINTILIVSYNYGEDGIMSMRQFIVKHADGATKSIGDSQHKYDRRKFNSMDYSQQQKYTEGLKKPIYYFDYSQNGESRSIQIPKIVYDVLNLSQTKEDNSTSVDDTSIGKEVMSNEDAIIEATRLGTKAFHDGLDASPVLNKEFMEFLKPFPTDLGGIRLELMRAYSSAWMQANIDAPLSDSDIVVPDIEEVLRAKYSMSGDDILVTGDYLPMSYEDMTPVQRLTTLNDSMLSTDQIRKFREENFAYTVTNVKDLPEIYQKAFGGYVTFKDSFQVAKKAMVDILLMGLKSPVSQLNLNWTKLHTDYNSGNKFVPADGLFPGSHAMFFSDWVKELLSEYRQELHKIASTKRQVSRAEKFPYQPSDEVTAPMNFDNSYSNENWRNNTNYYSRSSLENQGLTYTNKSVTVGEGLSPGLATQRRIIEELGLKSFETLAQFQVSPTEWEYYYRNKVNLDTVVTPIENLLMLAILDKDGIDGSMYVSEIKSYTKELSPYSDEIIKKALDRLVGKSLIAYHLDRDGDWYDYTKTGRAFAVNNLGAKDSSNNISDIVTPVIPSSPSVTTTVTPDVPTPAPALDQTIYTHKQLELKGYVFTGLPPAEGDAPSAELMRRAALRLNVALTDLVPFRTSMTKWEMFYDIGVKDTPVEPESPVTPAEDETEVDDTTKKDLAPERAVKAPKVKIADGVSYWNITIGVNEKTKKLMFVPTEQAKSNNVGIVRKREAKPVALFLSHVYKDTLHEITRQIRAGNRKGAARTLVIIANSIRGYLVATVNEQTPFPNKLADRVTADFGPGLEGQKHFMRYLQGKATSTKRIYKDTAKLKSLAGIKDIGHHEKEEASSFLA